MNVTLRTEVKWKSGFVALLDCMGTRSLSEADTEEFLRSSADDENLANAHAETAVEYCEPGIHVNNPPVAFSFADNLAISWAVQEFSLLTLGWFSSIIAGAIVSGLKNGNRWRGAMAYGRYLLREGNTGILGPAVAQAAHIFEKTDWVGVIATDSLGLLAEAGNLMSASRDKPVLEEALVRYPFTPLKAGRKPHWCVAWPQRFLGNPKEGWDCPEANFLNLMAKPPFPEIAELKRENTIKFFRWYRKRDERMARRRIAENTPGTVTDDPGNDDLK